MCHFIYCPFEMSQVEAYGRAKQFLASDSIVVVSTKGVMGRQIKQGERLKAWPRDTYLVRVEADGSQEIIDRNIGD
jgi:hypothetical protein